MTIKENREFTETEKQIMSNRAKGISLAVITAVMWGIMGIFVRSLSQYQFTNLEISFFRCALAGGAYFLFCFYETIRIKNRPQSTCDLSDLRRGGIQHQFCKLQCIRFQDPGGCGYGADVYESHLGCDPRSFHVWRKTGKKTR